MNRTQAFLLSLSILIPLITGLIRYRHLPVSYFPLIALLGIGFLNEMISYLFFYHSSNAVPTNIYFLLEFLIYMVQFRKWRNILRRTWLYRSIMFFMVLVWVFENVIMRQIVVFSPLFQIGYSFVLILIAVNQLNWLVVNEKGTIIINPVFIICIAIITFYSYKVLTEVFYYYAPENLMKNDFFVIESYLNVGYNILLAIAILCIPRKRDFIRPSL